MSKPKESSLTLADAPQEIQLAVDLIQLLEEHRIETEVAIDALQIVLNDFKQKQAAVKRA